MNLRIPQTQIGSGAVLGILGTVGDCCVKPMVTHAQFILSIICTEDYNGFYGEQIAEKLGVEVSETFPLNRKPNTYPVILLFTLTVDGELRNPRAFLKAIARKVSKVCLDA